jgi:uncharacterized protein (TIGR02421 family)
MTDTTISPDINQEAQTILDIDQNINRLVGRIELLAYVNPVNIAQERKEFFKSKYTYEPSFRYRKVKFKTYKLHRLLFSQRLERIENEEIRNLYKDIIYTYSGLLQCIETIGSPDKKFYFNSLRFFGTPIQKMVDNAKYILHFDETAKFDKRYTPTIETSEAVNFFKNYGKEYEFDFQIRTSSAMSAAAMVSNTDRALILKKNHLFSEHQLQVLAHHEIGVHLVTTFNAAEQPLQIFSNGFPNNVETQEGLAVMSEYLSGNLTLSRLKELAYRVIAVDSLNKGFSFSDTFDLIHGQYKLDRESAFNITLRVHRGGGWTKDALYLSGLSKIYQSFIGGKDIGELFLGKCSMEYTDAVEQLKQLDLVKPLQFKSQSFSKSLNSNETLDFVLKNLK